MNRFLSVSIWTSSLLMLTPLALAQQASPLTPVVKFEQLPGHENYQKVKRLQRKRMRDNAVTGLRWTADGDRVAFKQNGDDKLIDLTSSTPQASEFPSATKLHVPPKTTSAPRLPVARAAQREIEPSPNQQWLAVHADNNVVLRPAKDNEQPERNITTEGTDRRRFGTGCWVYGEELDQDEAMWWSSDSALLVYYEVNETEMQDYYLTLGNTASYTRIDATRYPKAGSPNPQVGLWVYDVAKQTKTRLNIPGAADQYLFGIRFVPNSRKLLVHRTNRRQDVLDLLLVDLDENTSTTVVSEQQPTWQHNHPTLRFLADGKRFVWETERTGWKQFELRNTDGSRLNGLSDNEGHPVHEIVKLDEEAGWFYYSAYSDQNPYNLQLHRCRLDGTQGSRITSSPMNHRGFQVSPNHRWVLAKRQQLDTPVSTVVYEAATGRLAATVGQASSFEAQFPNLPKPELFSFLANDGKTRIYGTLHKPANFSPEKKYPLLIDVYGGPQSIGLTNDYRPLRPICELGFLVAKVGNRGTVGRGKAFESANYRSLGVPDLDDQASAVKFLAERNYIDGSRVGIYGHSYGGYMSALALLRYPDVFHVGVAGAPVTDWRNYDSIYTERYLQLPDENPDGYDAGSCVKLADKLQGKLLLVHGLIDNNVHPSNTWQLTKALQQSDKRFDMMIYPGFQHGIGSTYEALRWEYFCRHLKPTP